MTPFQQPRELLVVVAFLLLRQVDFYALAFTAATTSTIQTATTTTTNPFLPLTSTALRATPVTSTTSPVPSDVPTKTQQSSSSSASSSSSISSWFPTRIQDTMDYDHVVSRLFLRHLVTETYDMATVAVQQYLQLLSSSSTQASQSPDPDPFATLARSLSACVATRNQGGKIGWVERTNSHNGADSELEMILPAAVVSKLYRLKPKAGDVHILSSSRHDDDNSSSNSNNNQEDENRRWHVVQVLEVWTNLFPTSTTTTTTTPTTEPPPPPPPPQLHLPRTGSFTGMNRATPRKRFKGAGVVTEFPTYLQSYYIETVGCQMNVADSERLAGVLQHGLGLTAARTGAQADVVIFNTCSIREHAQDKLYAAIGPYAIHKRTAGARAVVLIVTGCVAQQEGAALLKRIPEVDVVLGPQYVPYLRNVLQKVAAGHQMVVTAPMMLPEMMTTSTTTTTTTTMNMSTITTPTTPTLDPNDGLDATAQPVRGHDVRAWVNVIYGCNEHCTYCVVPATRGMEVSRTMEAIWREIHDLHNAGYKEVTLLGQNIDAYGRDMVPKRTFGQLLEYLNAHLQDMHSPMRIRYATSHPRYFSDRVIGAVAHLPHVCECFHMPFQAGDDEVLKHMRRGYTYDSYLRIIHKIRAQAPDAAICADVIVGFPGETEAQFQKTLQLMDQVKFDNINSFAYSPRPNTEAALWANWQIDESVKADRLQRVQQLAAQHALERSQRYVGRTMEVLIEDANPRYPHQQVMGRIRQGRHVYLNGTVEELRGKFVQVRITQASTWSLMGELVVDYASEL